MKIDAVNIEENTMKKPCGNVFRIGQNVYMAVFHEGQRIFVDMETGHSAPIEKYAPCQWLVNAVLKTNE